MGEELELEQGVIVDGGMHVCCNVEGFEGRACQGFRTVGCRNAPAIDGEVSVNLRRPVTLLAAVLAIDGLDCIQLLYKILRDRALDRGC